MTVPENDWAGWERGSVLLGTVVLVAVLTLLSLAVFDLSLVESNLVRRDYTYIQALEVAEAGISQGLRLLYLDLVCDIHAGEAASTTNCAKPASNPSFQDVPPTIAGVVLSMTNDCPGALTPDGDTSFRLLRSSVAFPSGGQYTICVKPTSALQAYLRARGTFQTDSRLVEVFAKAVNVGNPSGAGLLAGGASGGPIIGSALVAGSVHIPQCQPGGNASCVAIQFAGGSGLQNNYLGMDAALLSRIPHPLPQGPYGDTLGAVLKVKEGIVRISSNSAHLGQNEIGDNGRNGVQDPLTDVRFNGVWDGSQGNCPPLNGTTTSNNRCNVWTLNSGSYSDTSSNSFSLSAPIIIKDTGYKCFFLPPESACTNPAPVPGSNSEFFYSNSWHIDDTRGEDGCDVADLSAFGGTGTLSDCTAVLSAVQVGNLPKFGTKPAITDVPIKTIACARQGGSACTVHIGSGQIQPSIDGVPARPDGLPVAIYIKGMLATSPSTDTSYTGKTMILTDVTAATTGIQINSRLLSDSTTGRSWCDTRTVPCEFAFPGNHFLWLMTKGNVEFPSPGGGGYLVLAILTAEGTTTIQGQTQFAGMFASQKFDMGSNVPKFFQAPYDPNWVFSFIKLTKLTASNWREIR
jgi:hypothetical protein